MSINPVNKFDIVGGLPLEVGLEVFSNLNAKSLAVVAVINKYWNQLSKVDKLKHKFDAKALGYKRVSFIDEAAWITAKVDPVKNGLSFDGPRLDQYKLIKELQKCLAWPIEKVNGIKPGVTIITIPKGLSVNKLQALTPKVFGWVLPGFTEKYGNIEVSNAYTIIITDHVMEETRAKDPKQQVIEIQKHGGERPKAIEVIALLVLTFLISGKRLYSGGKVVLHGKELNLSSYTRCDEEVADCQVVVGGFVGSLSSDSFAISSWANDSVNLGLGALWKC